MYVPLTLRYRTGFVLEGVRWRANPDCGERIGDAGDCLAQFQSLEEAIGQVDEATCEAPADYINCAHPTHFASELERGA